MRVIGPNIPFLVLYTKNEVAAKIVRVYMPIFVGNPREDSMVRTNWNERTTSKRSPQFSVGISEIFCQMVSTSRLQVLGSSLFQWNLDSRFHSLVGYLSSILDSKALDSGFHKQNFPGFWILQAKIFQFRESGYRVPLHGAKY